jgi:hypothetical protein
METVPGSLIQSWIDELTMNMARTNPVRTTITQKSFSMSLIRTQFDKLVLYMVLAAEKIKQKSTV